MRRRVLLTLAGVVLTAAGMGAIALAYPQSTPKPRDTSGPLLALHRQAPLRAVIRGLAAGDQVQRTVDVRNTAGAGGRLQLRVRVTRKGRHSPLVSNRRLGLRVRVDACSRPWRRVKRTHAFTCKGRVRTLLRPVAVLGKLRLRHAALRPHRLMHLRITVSLPGTAPNSMERRGVTLRYRFVAVATPR